MNDSTTPTVTSALTVPPERAPSPRLVGVLGTGQFASAFTQRLVAAGFSVALGSRSPQRRRASLPWNDGRRLTVPDTGTELPMPSKTFDDMVKVVSLEECVTSSDIIIVAIHGDHFEKIFNREFSHLCAGKILVDVSNRTRARRIRTNSLKGKNLTKQSNAQRLARLVPEAKIVKAFNNISAYVMENDVTAGGTRTVTVAGDDVSARGAVCALARELRFEPEDGGGLRNAWILEQRELKVFSDWAVALLTTLLTLFFWLLFAVSRFFWVKSVLHWDQLPLKVLNKVFGASTLTLLALTYLPSTWAACLQMVYGTKHRRFPRWLDVWLKARKQLGLMAFAVISLHAIISALILSPSYMSSWFKVNPVQIPVSLNSTQQTIVFTPGKVWMNWIGELSLLIGVLAFAMMALLAVTSLPSVTKSLNWAEWRLMHACLGYVMLTLSMMHVYVMGVPKWAKTGFPAVLFRVKFMSVVLPTMVLLSRLLLLLPCVAAYLHKIRRGWERKSAITRVKV